MTHGACSLIWWTKKELAPLDELNEAILAEDKTR